MNSHSSRWQNCLLVAGILLVALNLRPAVTSISPLAERMRLDGLSRETIGSMTTIPLLLFGLVGLWAGWLGSRFGLARSLGAGLLVLGLGCFVRSVSGGDVIWLRLGGTVLIGTGIAMGNVLLPGLVKSRFPHHIGPMTSLYSTGMNLGAAFGFAAAVPLANHLAGGWNASLASWGVFAAVTLCLWIPQMLPPPARHSGARPLSGILQLVRQRRAWQVAIFMGLQSAVFYSSVSWLPTILQYRGLSETTAAGWVTALQISGCVASLVVPTLAGRCESQSIWILVCLLGNAISIPCILYLPTAYAGVAVITLGLGVNSSFGLALLLIALRSKDAGTAASLSSMAQAVGYLLAAPGPWIVGWLSETTGGWPVAMGAVVAIALAAAVTGWFAGRPGEMRLMESAN
ncbi:MAG: MFS transporter [Verrucomicrobiales bacterium]|nr:MFS transporter [Verrucomicrobiales bacterium]